MAGEGKYGILHVPEFDGGMSSFLRIGATADDDHTWRDHTDGNRITTTRGDKVEVIGGTYSMKVLGRRQFEASTEVEDGRVKEGGITFYGKSDIDFVQGPRGQRRIREATVKGEVHTTFHGDATEFHYGSRLESVTGDENAPSPIKDYPEVMTENPTVVDRTWAKSIASYTGSAKLPVPSISRETWAKEMVSKTRVKTTTDETTVEGASRSSMKAGSISSSTTVEGTMEDSTEADIIKNKTKASKIISETRADTKDEMYGDADSYTKGNSKTVVDGLETTINLGMVNEVVLGAMVEATVGAEATLSVGGTANVTIGLEASVSVTATLEGSVGPSIEMAPAVQQLFLNLTKTAPVRTNIAAVHLMV
jgi:hypothetical protein